MYRRGRSCFRKDDSETWVREWKKVECYGAAGSVIGATNIRTSRLVETGDCFSFVLRTMVDAAKMKALIDLQWACLRIASMSGSAGDPEFLKDDWDNGLRSDDDFRPNGDFDPDDNQGT